MEEAIKYIIGIIAAGGLLAAIFFVIKKYGKTELARDILEEVAQNNLEATKRAKKDAQKLSNTSYDDLVDKL